MDGTHAVDALAKKVRLLWLTVLGQWGVILIIAFIVVAWRNRESDIHRTQDIVVTDENGTPRIRLTANAPDAIIGGKEIPRGSRAAGLLIYDSDGQERGGYVTFANGNAALTLDSKFGQSALFAASPEGGAALRMWEHDRSLDLRADDDGARVTIAGPDKVLWQQPTISMGSDTCSAYREIAHEKRGAALKDCRLRFSEGECVECLSR